MSYCSRVSLLNNWQSPREYERVQNTIKARETTAQCSLFQSSEGIRSTIIAIRYGEHVIDFVDGGISDNWLR